MRVNTMRPTHTVGCDSALKSKETLMPAAPWKDLEDTVLSDISQTQRTDTVIPLL